MHTSCTVGFCDRDCSRLTGKPEVIHLAGKRAVRRSEIKKSAWLQTQEVRTQKATSLLTADSVCVCEQCLV
jgi:hypothetical protein